MSHSFTLTLTSKFREAEKTTHFVEEIDSKFHLDDDFKSRIMLALNEAATNAIVHGNKEDPEKKVFIEAQFDRNQVQITVEDQGEGFKPEAVPDPMSEENLLNTGGRGLFFMEQFADEVTYSNGGRVVTLIFNR
ncbi:MAG: ATP-binding protein [Balneolaceae bacterium]